LGSIPECFYFELNLLPTYNTELVGSLQRKNALTRQLLDRLRALPGVTSVAEMAEPRPMKYDFSDTIIPANLTQNLGRRGLNVQRWLFSKRSDCRCLADGIFETMCLRR